MSNTNGLLSTPGVFFTGDVNSNIYLRKGDDITLEQLTLTDGAGNDATISIASTNLQIAADNAVVFDPNGSGNANLSVSASGGTLSVASSNALNLVGESVIRVYPTGTSNAGMTMSSPSARVMNVAPPTVGFSQIFIQANKPMKSLTGTGTSTTALGMEDAGCNNWVTCTSAGTYNLQLANQGAPGAGIQPGTLLTFILNPASVGSVSFTNQSTTIVTYNPSTAPANQAIRVDFFTPDGIAFFFLKPSLTG